MKPKKLLVDRVKSKTQLIPDEEADYMNDEVSEFIDMIRRFHDDNRILEHFARADGRPESPTNPLTKFVYEFFLYNSLYQIDWKSTLEPEIVYHQKKQFDEESQQDLLEEFIKERDLDGAKFRQAFQPLGNLAVTGEWTEVVPDRRVTKKQGENFFGNIKSLQNAVKSGTNAQSVDTVYEQLKVCRRFVYKVRCNIFHGTKTLSEATESTQGQRIEVYFTFLHCLLTLFFEVVNNDRR